MKQSAIILAGAIGMMSVVVTSCCCHTHEHYEDPAYQCDTYVATLPPGARKAVYGGTEYYTYDNVFYRPHIRGWKIVPHPGR